MPRHRDPGRSVGSKLLDVLFAFDAGHPRLSLADLVRRTGLPHATTRRLALELVEGGALERQADGRFAVGVKVWELGTLAPQTESLRRLARPFIEDLNAALHQHVQLAVLDGDEAVIVELVSAPGAVDVLSRVGGRTPLHCSASGKVLLSHASPELVERVLDAPPRRYTPATKTDPAVLRRELAACRRTGTATVRGELTPDADSVAARILDRHGTVVAALSVVVRSGSVPLPHALPSVVAAGLGVSRRLGWQPGTPVRIGGASSTQ